MINMKKEKPSLWLREGEQSRLTKKIKEISKSFKGTDFEKIVKILEWINRKLKPSPKQKENATKILARRTVDKMIKDGFYSGCHDAAVVFVTLARSVGIPAKFLEGIDKINPQDRGHCVSEVFINERWIIVDPIPRVIYIIPRRSNFYKKNYLVGEGLDSWDVGVKSFDDWKGKSKKLIEKIKNIKIN